MQDLLERLERLANDEARASLRAGASEEALSAFARETGAPSDLVAIHRWHDGQTDGAPGLVGNDALLTLDGIRAERARLDEVLFSGDVLGADAWRETWLPFLTNGAGDCVCLDLATGRVLRHWHDSVARPVLAESIREWLTHVVSELEAGRSGDAPARRALLSDDWDAPVRICSGSLDTARVVLDRGGLRAAGNLLHGAFALLFRHGVEIGRPWSDDERRRIEALAARFREEPWVAFVGALALADIASDIPLRALVPKAEELATMLFDRLRGAPLPSPQTQSFMLGALALVPLRVPGLISNAVANGLLAVVSPELLLPATEGVGIFPTADPRWTR